MVKFYWCPLEYGQQRFVQVAVYEYLTMIHVYSRTSANVHLLPGGGGGAGNLGQLMLGMYRWPLRARTPL